MDPDDEIRVVDPNENVQNTTVGKVIDVIEKNNFTIAANGTFF